MHSSKTLAALLAILENIAAARRFTAEITFDEFSRSDLHLYAVVRALEIISEASRRLPPELRDRYADMPWKRVMGIGNVLRHEYDTVVASIVWETVAIFLSELERVVTAELAGRDEEPL